MGALDCKEEPGWLGGSIGLWLFLTLRYDDGPVDGPDIL